MQTIYSAPIESKSGLVQVSSNVWILETTEHLHSSPTTQTHTGYATTLIRLNSGNLVAICPTQLSSNLKTHLAKLGPVKYLILPDQAHSERTHGEGTHSEKINSENIDSWANSWVQTYPNIEKITLSELAHQQTKNSLQENLPTEKSELEWAEEIQHIFNTNSKSSTEAFLLHKASRTAIWINPPTSSQQKTHSTPPSQHILQTILQQDLECLIVAHHNFTAYSESKALFVPYIEGPEEISAFLQHTIEANSSKLSYIVNYSKEATQLAVSLLLVAPTYLLIALFTDIAYPKITKLIGTPTHHRNPSKNNVSLEKAK